MNQIADEIDFARLGVNILIERNLKPYTLYLGSDGIAYVLIEAGGQKTPQRLDELVVLLGEVTRHRKVPMLMKYTSTAVPSDENRKYWKQKDVCPFTSAEAILIENGAMKALIDYHLMVDAPERLTAFFEDMEEARKWLLDFVDPIVLTYYINT